MADTHFDYTPPMSLAPFFASEHRVRLVRGPIGSTKSTAMVMELFRRSCLQAPDADGIRRTKFAVVRNTLSQIEKTCLVTIQKTLRALILYKVSKHEVHLKFNDVESTWIFLPLDTPENVQRLLSLELTGAWVSEFREITPQLVKDVYSRCGRFPAELGQGVAPSWYGVIAETNSFSEDSPWFEELEVPETLRMLVPGKTSLPRANWFYLVQPGAYDEGADWLRYLVPSYYDDLLESNGEAWAAQYIHNKISPSLSSQAVFAKSFSREDHIVEGLQFIQALPLVIGLDTGRQPAAVFGQVDPHGRLNILASLHAENCGIEKFIYEHVQPLLARKFPRASVFAVVDPAGRQRSQIGEQSVIEAINECGISAIPASTNHIAPRLRAVEKYLNRRNGLAIDPVHNTQLVVALQYGYRFPRDKELALKELPEKSHPASDYCLHVSELVVTARGLIPIGEVQVGDFVQSPRGLDEVVATSLREASVVRVELEGGVEFLCTPDHLVAGNFGGSSRFIRADALQYGDELFFGGGGWGSRKVGRTPASAQSSGCASSVGGSLRPRNGVLTRVRAAIVRGGARVLGCVSTLGLSMTGNGSRLTPVLVTTGTRVTIVMLPSEFHCIGTFGRKRGRGIDLQKDWPGIESMRSVLPAHALCNSQSSNARDVELNTSASLEVTDPSFAPALRRVVSVSCVGSGLVVSLTTQRWHQFFAAGVLNHNCDGLQYLCLGVESRVLSRRVGFRDVAEARKYEPSAAGWT